jgi:hypothetical protein
MPDVNGAGKDRDGRMRNEGREEHKEREGKSE